MGFPPELLLQMYRSMALSRELDEYCCTLSPHWYPGIGEEAVHVGTFSALQPGDFAAPHYRGAMIVFHLMGLPLETIMAGVFCRRGSVTRGRLSGLHSGPIEHNVLPYVSNVLGPNCSLGTGAALSFRYRHEPRVAVASFGDGTTALGEIHETLNLAAVWSLPVVYVCQNNQYSISTRYDRALACTHISDWGARYGMPASTIDGNDVTTVYAAVSDAIARARQGGGPSFIEALTYRRTGHFIGDKAPYRPSEEVAEWESRDPLTRLEARLLEDHIVDQEGIARLHADVKAVLADAVAKAQAAPAIDVSELGLDEIYGARPEWGLQFAQEEPR